METCSRSVKRRLQALCQLGENIAFKSNYTAMKLNKIDGIQAPAIGDNIWKEFVVKFENGVTARHVHESLLKRGIHGGKLLTDERPDLGESMLLCVTELHSKESIDALVEAIEQIVTRGGAQ